MISKNLTPDKSFAWFDVQEPHDIDLERLNSEFGLPYLLVQDCLRPEHLPKYEFSEEGHFLMMRNYDSDSDSDATSIQELTRKIALFITPNRLVTIHRVKLDYVDEMADKCQKTDFINALDGLVHKIILKVIRSYEEPIANLQDTYDDFETDVLSKKLEQLSTNGIYHFRRKIFVIKRILKQTNDALYRFKDFWNENPSTVQDLRENIDQLYFRLDEISDNFEHLYQLHISLNNQRANQVMKVLTVFSTILLPLNFLASLYGMNFTHLPGLNSPTAFHLLIFIMIIMTLFAIWYFRRKGWFRDPKE